MVEADVGKMGRKQGKKVNYGQKERHIGSIKEGKPGLSKEW